MSAPLIAATIIASQNNQAAPLRNPVEVAASQELTATTEYLLAERDVLRQYLNHSDSLYVAYQQPYIDTLAQVAFTTCVVAPEIAKKPHMAPAPQGHELAVQGLGYVLQQATESRVGKVDAVYRRETGAPFRESSRAAKQGPLITQARELGRISGDGDADEYVARTLFSPPFEAISHALGAQPVEEITPDRLLSTIKKLVAPQMASERRLLSDTVAAWNSKRHPLQALRRRK